MTSDYPQFESTPLTAPIRPTLVHIAEVAGYIWQKGWGERNGGNITVDVTDYLTHSAEVSDRLATVQGRRYALPYALPCIAGRFFYAKGTQKRMRDIARYPMENGSIIRISDDGAFYTIVSDPPVAPTSELPSHLIVQNYLRQSGSRYMATLHTHPIELVALSHHPQFLDNSATPNPITRTLWSMIPETRAFAPLGLGVVPYQVPGSLELAEETLRQIRQYDVVLWEKHGVFAVGQDILDAFDQVDVLNKAARIYLDARVLGTEPQGMTEAQMSDLQQIFHLPTSRPC